MRYLLFMLFLGNLAASEINFVLIINDYDVIKDGKREVFKWSSSESEEDEPRDENHSDAHKKSKLKVSVIGDIIMMLSQGFSMDFKNPELYCLNRILNKNEVLLPHLVYTLIVKAESLKKIEGYTLKKRVPFNNEFLNYSE